LRRLRPRLGLPRRGTVVDITGERTVGEGVVGDVVVEDDGDGGAVCERLDGVGGGRALLVARFTSSETTDKSGDDDPFISDVPVAAVTTLR
jgi:hypothetical protein